MPKKKFIDRKRAVTFHLVHRSQQDPLAADENASQMVLKPTTGKNDKHIAEQHKYGIYFDDDYNYLQHLRETGTMEWERVEYKSKPDATINLPSSVFASEVEEDVGLLNKAAPESGLRVDLDPDIVAAMEDDFDFSDPNNELEDNFMDLANEECSDDEYDNDGDEECSSNFEADEGDEVGSLENPQHSFKKEETKSMLTKYSLTSSVIRRNEQLQLLDRRFERFYNTHYNDSEIGALDSEEVDGHIPLNSEILLQCAEEFEKEQATQQYEKPKERMPVPEYYESDSSEYETMIIPEKDKYDCQSIITACSNYRNQPKLIEVPKKQKIKVNLKTGMPTNVFDSNKLTTKALRAFDEEHTAAQNTGPKSVCAKSVISGISALSIRPKDETNEQKKERKKLLKEYRRERRIEKKNNKLAFMDEIKRQNKIAINNRRNIQGNQIL